MPATPLSAEALGLPEFDPGPDQDEGADGVFSLDSHARARAALEFALSVDDPSFNIFVLGPDRSGRMTSTLEFLNSHIQDRPVPNDWVFLNNFRRPHRPKPYALPAGRGRALRDRMEALVPQLREALSKAMGGEEYQSAVEGESAELRARIGEQIEALRTEARTHGLDIVQTQQGMMVVAVDDKGEALTPDKIPEDKRKDLEARGREISERLGTLTREAGRLQAEFATRMGDRTRQTAADAVDGLIDALAREFGAHRGIARWITEMRVDIVENLSNFQPLPPERRPPGWQPPERRYAVNLFVDHGEDKHPAVVVEPNPTYQNLFGSIEYHQQGGLLETDFSMLRAGSLHRANGGTLVLRAEALAAAGPSWQFLKGALRDGEIRVEELYRYGGVPVAGAPRPKPIPLDLKVVIVGAPNWYYTFFTADPEFQAYFKVKADIDADMDANASNLATYAGLIRRMAGEAAKDGCDESAVRRLL
ncbi:MAG: AAA family ATPase, partial [Rhodospirillaceae bacterium]|nr:AAA family ATPase [Rhodospirillaceae bacterium]